MKEVFDALFSMKMEIRVYEALKRFVKKRGYELIILMSNPLIIILIVWHLALSSLLWVPV